MYVYRPGIRSAALAVGMLFAAQAASAQTAGPASGAPTMLQTDNLPAPLGIDDTTPQFSWQLADSRRGARQTAYRVQVATSPELLASGKPDTWDSGRIASGQSLGVAYSGTALKPSTRYYWRVLAWDKDGNSYSPSEISWWETGLLDPKAWSGDASNVALDKPSTKPGAKPGANWVGYQTWDEAAVRKAAARWITPLSQEIQKGKQAEQRIAYRLSFTLDQPVRAAYLFVTGQDVASAWINGTQVATGAALPAWKQLPWKKYVQTAVMPTLHTGANLLAIQTTRYVLDPNGGLGGDPGSDPPAMSATLAVQLEDGSVQTFATGNASPGNGEWTASTHPGEGWTSAHTEDSSWKPAFCCSENASDPIGNPWPAQSVKALRRSFEISKPVAAARLYSTSLGAYEMFLNGKRAGDDVLAPGWTDYRLSLKYQTYDVTAQLTQGKNAIAALLAPGWYSTPLQWFQQPNVYGTAPPSLMAYLRIEYADGSVDWIVTDPSWKAEQSSILKSEIYDGETQDARLEQPGWSTAAFDASGWHAAQVWLYDNGERIDGQDFQPIRVERVLPAKAIAEPKPGVYIVDMGQEFSGVERLRLDGPAGTDVQVRTGEVLNPDGTLYTANLRTAKSTDHFILAGKGIEEFQPQFTFHGYRYLELTGLTAKPALDQIEGVVFHTAAPFDVQLKTASAMLNQLWQNILWGQRSNFVGVPTDCPQRDERLGWTADAQVFWRAASFNMDLAAFSRKFTADVRGTQAGSGQGATSGDLYGIFAPGISTTSSASGAGWSDAGVIIPWTSWVQTGDTQVLNQNWAAMTQYLGAIERTNPGFLWKNNAGIGFGDWLSPEGPTNFPLVATAYWAYDVTLMRQMSHALGKSEDEAHYAQLLAQIQAAFQKEFVRADGYIPGAADAASDFSVNNPELKAKGDTQTGYVLALHMRLVPDGLRAVVAQRLADKIEANHGLLGTGFLGTPYLLSVLTETGHRDLAYKLLLNTGYPSWGYLVGHGATTMWERWNGDRMRNDPSMNSYNHYAYGAVADWIYRYAAGIDTIASDPGFHTVYLHPTFDAQLGSIDFTYQSPYGAIRSAWTIQNAVAHWSLTIPANSTGWLPLTAEEAANWKLSGVPIAQSRLVTPTVLSGHPGFAIPAGSYNFRVSGIR